MDLQGRLFLEETLPKNIATSIKDTKFHDFFVRRIRPVRDTETMITFMRQEGIPVEDYPFVSPCGRELNFIRPAATPIVFHSLDDEANELIYAGTLRHLFSEDALALSETTGLLYHRIVLPTTATIYGLLRSSIAVALSERIIPLDDSGSMGIESTSSGEIQPIAWLPAEAEPGPWAMPANDE
jgi:hypothetical protein